MNYSKAIFLINNEVRAIACTYESGENAKREIFKTLDPNIDEGDLVVVPSNTRHNVTTCKVVETDIDIDFDDSVQMDWIIGTIDMHDFEKISAQEREAIKTIKSAELRQKRESLREAMFKDHVETLKVLPIASIEEDSDDASSGK